MTVDRDALVERMRQAIAVAVYQRIEADVRVQQMTEDEIDVLVAAALDIAMEEAAKVCDAQAIEQANKRDEVPEDSEDWQVYNQAAFISASNAAAIRALKSKP